MINPNEEQIIGNWTLRDNEVLADDVCRRIESLVANHLHCISTDSSGWDVLYRDPTDQRLWELTYRRSEMHNGGPPALNLISGADAAWKYGSKYDDN